VHVSRLPHRVFPAAIAALAAALAFPATGASVASHPLTTGLAPSAEVYSGDQDVVFDRMHAAGMSSIDVAVDWVSIAPADKPASWKPADPSDPHYDWSSSDARVQAIARAGFQPIIVVATAPTWARMVPTFPKSAPQPEDFAAFMHAAAERYSGRRPGFPRVRYWRIWSEPNISVYFKPQFNQTTKKFVSPDIYRNMVNRSAAEIHAVNKDNVVIAGGTAPFRDIDPQVLALDKDWGPLKFMRRLLCVSDSGRPTCASRVSFDIWSTHPYTSGGPTHHAELRYDVSLGDLPEMRATLAAAVKAGHVVSTERVRFWVTEFGWDSNKPDPCAVPLALLKRWVPEAVYRMWANGIEHVSWFRLMDDPLTVTIFQRADDRCRKAEALHRGVQVSVRCTEARQAGVRLGAHSSRTGRQSHNSADLQRRLEDGQDVAHRPLRDRASLTTCSRERAVPCGHRGWRTIAAFLDARPTGPILQPIRARRPDADPSQQLHRLDRCVSAREDAALKNDRRRRRQHDLQIKS
jgi:hypothetical protein